MINAERVRPAFRPGSLAVVTGGAHGIGKAVAEVLAEEGLRVAIWDLDRGAASSVADSVNAAGGDAVAFKVDVTDEDSVGEGWAAVQELGTCAYLVNNASVSSAQSLSLAEGLTGTVGGVVNVTEQWLGLAGDDASSVVNLSSIAGHEVGAGFLNTFYPVGKGAISAYTRHLAVREGGRPRANAVAPGFTLTPRSAPKLNDSSAPFQEWVDRVPMRRAAYPHEIAELVVFLLSERASYINGEHIRVDGGFVLAH